MLGSGLVVDNHHIAFNVALCVKCLVELIIILMFSGSVICLGVWQIQCNM